MRQPQGETKLHQRSSIEGCEVLVKDVELQVVGGWVQFRRESTPTLPPLSHKSGEHIMKSVPPDSITVNRKKHCKYQYIYIYVYIYHHNVVRDIQVMYCMSSKTASKTRRLKPVLGCWFVLFFILWWPPLDASRRIDERGRYSQVPILDL